MFRVLHRIAGLVLALVLTVVSLTGVILSVFPLLNADRTAARLDAGALAEAVMQSVPGAEQILVDSNNVVTAVAFGPEGLSRQLIDPASGAVLGPVSDSGLELWFESLHRSLFLSDSGQIVVLFATLGLIGLAVSGLWLAARRLGGWRRLLARDRGTGAGRLHLRLARYALVGLMLSSLTGLWMGAATLGLIDEVRPLPAVPASVSSGEALPASELAALSAIPGDELRAIVLPRANLPGQAWQVETDAGAGYIDPVTGEMLSWADRPLSSRIMDLVHMLHTGQGAAWIGLLLGLSALSVPVLSGSGLLLWLSGRSRPSALPQTDAAEADLVVLVGSEGGTTWRFARAFATQAHAAGLGVHLAEMNAFAPERYTGARAILAFAATYGDGDAPAGATGFLDRLDALDAAPTAPLSVLGFGDSSYPAFCGYAAQVAEAARAKGWAQTLELCRIDRQSAAGFADWARNWSAATGIALGDVAEALEPQPTRELMLVSAHFYGEDVQAPTAILRFALPPRTLSERLFRRGWGGFEAGDLLNILPEGSEVARSYSLASSARDGWVEICVRKRAGGLCSGQLFALEPGDTITARLQPNPAFHAPKDSAPLILIGAGAGIGALAGFIRANRRKHPLQLVYGSRSTGADLPYGADLAEWQGEGRLSALSLAWSRGDRPRYVQQAIEDDASRLRESIARGARVMICGGREMGAGVAAALDEVLAPLGLTTEMLKQENRYVADVF